MVQNSKDTLYMFSLINIFKELPLWVDRVAVWGVGRPLKKINKFLFKKERKKNFVE